MKYIETVAFFSYSYLNVLNESYSTQVTEGLARAENKVAIRTSRFVAPRHRSGEKLFHNSKFCHIQIHNRLRRVPQSEQSHAKSKPQYRFHSHTQELSLRRSFHDKFHMTDQESHVKKTADIATVNRTLAISPNSSLKSRILLN